MGHHLTRDLTYVVSHFLRKGALDLTDEINSLISTYYSEKTSTFYVPK